MSYQTTQVAVAKYIAANFPSTWPIIHENHPFEPTPGKPWVRWGIRPADEFMADIGARMERVIGNIFFQIFVGEDNGTLDAQKISDILVGLFFQHYISDPPAPLVRCQAAKQTYIGADESGWQQYSVLVPYETDAFIP